MTPEMRYVYTVYKEGSFLKAAAKLFITQPALSIAVQKVEESLGMLIFDRSRRPLQLTEAGEIYIDSIKKIMLIEEMQNQKLSDIQNLAVGTIRVGGSHYLNSYILPEIFTGFSKKYPGIKLEIFEHGSYELAAMLSDQKLDVTFSCHPTFVKNFERYKIFDDNIILAVPKENAINQCYEKYALTASDIVEKKHLQPDCPAVDLSSFTDIEFIVLKKGNNLYDRALEMFETAGFEPKVKLYLSQLVTAYHLSAANMAASLVSDRLVHVTDSSLTFYRIDSELTNRIFYALLPNREYISKATRTFIQYIRRSLTVDKS